QGLAHLRCRSPGQALATVDGAFHCAGRDVRAARAAGPGGAAVLAQEKPMTEPLLSAKRLTKRFGGLAAVNEVSVDLWLGRIHAVIGPNGAGKSTLTNLLSGDLPPTTGTVTLDGQDVTGWNPETISRVG